MLLKPQLKYESNGTSLLSACLCIRNFELGPQRMRPNSTTVQIPYVEKIMHHVWVPLLKNTVILTIEKHVMIHLMASSHVHVPCKKLIV
jgi:hypothetical protein